VTERGTLRTPRLRLEPMDLSLAGELWEATQSSLKELRRWMRWAEQASLESTQAFAEEAERRWNEGLSYTFAVRDADGVVGGFGLDIHAGEGRIGELGYWIRTDRASRGYATEAGQALIDFAFAELGLYRLELRAGVDNLASQRVAEKLGFRREGRLRRGCAHGRTGYDCYVFGLLATDPRS
jgi:RimJ/RimL family protein N-acetyltransferase